MYSLLESTLNYRPGRQGQTEQNGADESDDDEPGADLPYGPELQLCRRHLHGNLGPSLRARHLPARSQHLEMIMDWQQDLGSFITKLDDFILPYIKKALIMFQPILFLEISRSTAKFSVVGQISGTVLVFSIIKIPISCDLPNDMSLSSPSRVMSPGYHPSVRTRKG
jgi:hypothetical protein